MKPLVPIRQALTDGKTTDAGLPAIIVDQMKRSPDGFDATREVMASTADNLIEEMLSPGDDRAAFERHFDEGLSASSRTLIYQTLLRNPGASYDRIRRAVRNAATLSQAAEINGWAHAWLDKNGR